MTCRRVPRFARLALTASVSLLLVACGGGSGGSGTGTSSTSQGGGNTNGNGGGASTTYTVGGAITGLNASGLVLTDNGGDNLAVSSGTTAFVFATALASGAAYDVAVSTQPTGQTCSVANGSGAISGANVSNIQVACVASTNTAATFTELYAFPGGIGGATPEGSLIQASDGNFYGMTYGGGSGLDYMAGTDDGGLIFKYDVTSKAESILYSFNYDPSAPPGAVRDGANPMGSLIQGKDGNLYGLTCYGGTYDQGTIFEYNLQTGHETVLYSFGTVATDDGFCPQGSLLQATDGNFYGLTAKGGAYLFGTVFEYNVAKGAEIILHSFGNGSDGATPARSLIQGRDGNLYGVTSGGGTAGDGTVFAFSLATPAESVLYSFRGGTDGVGPTGSLVQASDGNFYGLTEYGGSAGGTIFEYSPSTQQESVLYMFGAQPSDGAGPIGNSLIQASDGNLYGETTNGGQIGAYGTVFEFNLSTKTETVIYRFGYGSKGADGATSSLNGHLIQASDGNFYGMTSTGGTGYGDVFRIN